MEMRNIVICISNREYLCFLAYFLNRVIRSLEGQLETKDDTLKQVKRSLLKEVQDSNALR